MVLVFSFVSVLFSFSVGVGVVLFLGVVSLFFFEWSSVFSVFVISPSCVGSVCLLSGLPGGRFSSVEALGTGLHLGL